ncbi:MAG: DUF5018 domain-containing protein, partial [Treponema sp.]|nr:DUF5018 domain-containing protein [Treponema sp.]
PDTSLTSDSLTIGSGPNVFKIVVTADSGKPKTYTLTANKAPSSNTLIEMFEILGVSGPKVSVENPDVTELLIVSAGAGLIHNVRVTHKGASVSLDGTTKTGSSVEFNNVNFSSPKTFTVIAENGLDTSNYTVTVMDSVAKVTINSVDKYFDNLNEAFNAVNDNQTATITVLQDIEEQEPISISEGKKITLTNDGVRKITLGENGSMFTVSDSGTQLTIQGNSPTNTLTLQGKEDNNAALVTVSSSGAFTLGANAIITDNKRLTTSSHNGGGVYVESGGAFTMTGGSITNNTADRGGGVCVTGTGIFNMDNGIISGNSANSGGGGVVLWNIPVSGGRGFIMNNGSITNNTTSNTSINTTNYGGGGVVVQSGTFTMYNGTISGNSSAYNGGGVSTTGGNARFVMDSGTISSNTAANRGGGVCMRSGTFTMNNGEIKDNTANSSEGAGVCVIENGTFTIEDGAISAESGETISFLRVDSATMTLNIRGGKISTTTGYAIYNFSGNLVSITGGEITATGTGTAIRTGLGSINISGSKVMATTGYAIYNSTNTVVTISGTNTITSANDTATIYSTDNNGAVRISNASGLSNTGTGLLVSTPDGRLRIDNGVEIPLDRIFPNTAKVRIGTGAFETYYTTLLGALDLNSNDTRTVTLLKDIEHAPITINGAGKDITLAGGSRTISLSLDGSLFTVGNGAKLTIRGMTLNGGTNNSALVTVNNTSTFTLGASAKITNNTNYGGSGGGVFVNSGGTFIMNGADSYIGQNGAGSGGGVYVSGGGTFTMSSNSLIESNTASGDYTSYGYGGGVSCYGTFTMENNARLSSNAASKGGGGVYVNGGSFTMNNQTTISGNSTSSFGGGLYINSGEVRLNGGIIYGANDNTPGVTTGAKNSASANSGSSLYKNAGGHLYRYNGSSYEEPFPAEQSISHEDTINGGNYVLPQ